MNQKYYCPDCHQEVEVVAACGATNYFCNHCKVLVSKSRVMTKSEKEQEEGNK